MGTTLIKNCSQMEIIPEGRNFRLVQDEELPSVLDALNKYMPHSLKVSESTLLIISISHDCE
jgi:hypothetical protein